ncbi:hypothetical protein ACIBFB_21110 [Nocardiopsis sp. NPDC050513]|uniref:hypothetical protein n=1 Tax=Nocardiopsis sp. NPDC050513 TaxID=3364338 RepID=UPI0037A03B37
MRLLFRLARIASTAPPAGALASMTVRPAPSPAVAPLATRGRQRPTTDSGSVR